LRITCSAEHTDLVVELLQDRAAASEVAVVPAASRVSGGDLVLAEVPRASIDPLLDRLPTVATVFEVHVSLQPSEQLLPQPPGGGSDDEVVVWAQVVQDVHRVGHLSWMNVLLMVVAAMIAAIGIIQDQLLLIVGAMALSPDYFPVADTCLSIARHNRRRALAGLRTLAACFAAAVAGAFVLTVILLLLDLDDVTQPVTRQLTLFISQPGWLSMVVALLAGVAGALAITLPDARGLVGVFVSITTVPAAANIGVALAETEWHELWGAAVQLLVNVLSLLVAGVLTLEARHRLGGAPVR